MLSQMLPVSQPQLLLQPSPPLPPTFAQALAILPAAFVLFWCLWRCRKAAVFLGLLFKDILKEAAPLFLPLWQPQLLSLPLWAARPVASKTLGGVPQQEPAWKHTH